MTTTQQQTHQWATHSIDDLTAHPGNTLPEPDAELVADITAHGVTDPLHIVLTGNGEPLIVDGRKRAAAARAAGLAELPYSRRPLIRVTDLMRHPRNARKDARADREMVESIRVNGVRIPLKITLTDKGWKVIDGHVRLDGAKKAKITHVPYERDDERDDAGQYLDMVATARHRRGLKAAEEHGALFAAAECGASLAEVKAAGGLRTQTEARKVIKAGGSKTVSKVTAHHGLTLDQMAALADLPTDAAQRIEQAAAESRYTPNITHMITRETQAAANAVKAEKHRAKLTKAGARIVPADELSPNARPVAELDDDARTHHHKRCKGHAWTLETGDDHYTAYCVNAVLYEHIAPASDTVEQVSRAAAKAHRAAVKAGNRDWDAATAERRAFIGRLVTARTLPDKTVNKMHRFVAEMMISGGKMAERLTANGQDEVLADLLSIKAPEAGRAAAIEKAVAKAPFRRLPVVMFAVVAAGFECKTRQDAWRTDDQHNPYSRPEAARWFRLLRDLGHDLHPIEAAVADEETYHPEQHQPTAENIKEAPAQTPAATVFALLDEVFMPGTARTLTVRNPEGSGLLHAMPIEGATVRDDAPDSGQITEQIIRAAEAHARDHHGDNPFGWPEEITITRP
ncbi:ParB/RepB/Spo0J family partition protein [Streptomyces sp. NPDC090442]|uniref:ParB/RepB/Spo0J family partition protein n=1 Tax=Streptomyces sp. NPDC090442 TaxID=3365962 RepID=UPI0038206A8C